MVQISHSSPLFNEISNALNFVTSLAPEVARMAPDVATFAPDLLQGVISTGGGVGVNVIGDGTGGLNIADITAVDPLSPR